MPATALRSAVECATAIAAAEAHGWSTGRHDAAPTTDVPLASLASLLPWWNALLEVEHVECHDVPT